VSDEPLVRLGQGAFETRIYGTDHSLEPVAALRGVLTEIDSLREGDAAKTQRAEQAERQTQQARMELARLRAELDSARNEVAELRARAERAQHLIDHQAEIIRGLRAAICELAGQLRDKQETTADLVGGDST